MFWPDSPLVLGIFVERLHRFGAIVKIRGRNEYCHVTNSGRLRELLYPGAKVALVDHNLKPKTSDSRSKALRKTRFAVRLAYYRKKWVCIEANIAPQLLKEAWQKGLVEELKDYDLLQSEVPLNAHTRFDFFAQNSKTDEKAWVEVKCVTLVDEKKVARFPDAPSECATKHLKELMLLSYKPNIKCFVFFILQNPFGTAVGPKDDTDPVFGETMRKAHKSQMVLRAYHARVSLKEAGLTRQIPILV